MWADLNVQDFRFCLCQIFIEISDKSFICGDIFKMDDYVVVSGLPNNKSKQGKKGRKKGASILFKPAKIRCVATLRKGERKGAKIQTRKLPSSSSCMGRSPRP